MRQIEPERGLRDWLYEPRAKCLRFFPWARGEKCYFFKSPIWETPQACNCEGKGRPTCQAKHLRGNWKYCKQQSNPLCCRDGDQWWRGVMCVCVCVGGDRRVDAHEAWCVKEKCFFSVRWQWQHLHLTLPLKKKPDEELPRCGRLHLLGNLPRLSRKKKKTHTLFSFLRWSCQLSTAASPSAPTFFFFFERRTCFTMASNLFYVLTQYFSCAVKKKRGIIFLARPHFPVLMTRAELSWSSSH